MLNKHLTEFKLAVLDYTIQEMFLVENLTKQDNCYIYITSVQQNIFEWIDLETETDINIYLNYLKNLL